MVADEGQRLHMVARLQHALGSDAAGTLVTYLMPPGGWSEVATKGDLAELRAELAEVRAELKSELAEVRAELKSELAEVRAELTGEVAGLRGEVVAVEGRLRTELSAQTRTLFFSISGLMVGLLTAYTAAIRIH